MVVLSKSFALLALALSASAVPSYKFSQVQENHERDSLLTAERHVRQPSADQLFEQPSLMKRSRNNVKRCRVKQNSGAVPTSGAAATLSTGLPSPASNVTLPLLQQTPQVNSTNSDPEGSPANAIYRTSNSSTSSLSMSSSNSSSSYSSYGPISNASDPSTNTPVVDPASNGTDAGQDTTTPSTDTDPTTPSPVDPSMAQATVPTAGLLQPASPSSAAGMMPSGAANQSPSMENPMATGAAGGAATSPMMTTPASDAAATSPSAATGDDSNVLTETHTGDGTYYATGLGACGITNKDTDFIAAAAESFFDSFPGYTGGNPNNNPICGRKVRATYQGKSVEVAITDRCGGCDLPGSLDFSPSAFSQLADMSVGRIHNMTWVFI